MIQTMAVNEEVQLSSQLKKKLLDDDMLWIHIKEKVSILKPVTEII